MSHFQKGRILAAAICVLFVGTAGVAHAQTRDARRESSNQETNNSQVPSTKKRILLNIARAVIDVLCAEYGDCSRNNPATNDIPAPESREDRSYLTPGFAGSNSNSPHRNFSFTTPQGWQTFEDRTSVTVAPPSDYVNGNLTNGVILGMFDLNGSSFESGTEKYARALIANNKYLKRVGWPESNNVNNVPCITNRMEGQSPKTQYIENVVVYTCRRNAQKLFYVVTVNSGPNANRYEDENNRITQSISFH